MIGFGNIENIKKLEFDMDEFTVLGLLGPAGSGKDLTADWLVEKGFVKVAFADPMKRFALYTFGLGWERLWGPSEKRNEMFPVSEAWWFEAIGHLGDSVEEIIQEILPVGSKTDGYLKLHDWFSNLRKSYRNEISARVILQTLGTEWGRAIDPLMWARYAYKVADMLKHRDDIEYTQGDGIRFLEPGIKIVGYRPQGVVIPDHRFKNEVDATHEIGGYVMRLRRLAMEKDGPDIGVAGHKSEAEQKELPDDLFNVVFNFPEGVSKVHELLEAAYTEKLWTKGNTQRMHLL